MYENFYKLSEEKQKHILDSAMLEFSKFGYEKTSVEQIAVKAGISKSMVFHYFKSKLKLFEFLINYSSDYILEKYKNYIDRIKDLDYIERYKLASLDKINALNSESALFRFSGSLYLHPFKVEISKECKDKLQEIIELRTSYVNVMHSEVEYTKLRKDINKETSLKFIKWIMDGYTQELIVRLQNQSLAEATFDEEWKLFDSVLDKLKILFYTQKGE